MLTQRSLSAATVVGVLLAGLPLASSAQDAEPAPVTFVTGTVVEAIVHTEAVDAEALDPGPPSTSAASRSCANPAPPSSSSRSPGATRACHPSTGSNLGYHLIWRGSEEVGAIATATSHLLLDEAGSWSGTGRLLPDGRVVIVGSGIANRPAPPEIRDPVTASFSPAGTLEEAPSHGPRTVLPDGRILFIGGMGYEEDPSFAAAGIWDSQTASFTPAGALEQPRQGHTATLLPDGTSVTRPRC